MSLGGHSPLDGADERSNPTEGNLTVKPAAQGILSGRGPAVPTDFISIQPEAAAAAPAEASQSDLQKPTCPRCGLTVPEQRLLPLCQVPGPQQGSSSLVHSSRRSERRRSRSDEATSPADRCLQLLLACLSCQVSVLLLGLLEACSSCLHALCSSCCHACAHCCSAIQEAPVEELNCHTHCHSVMFESCCEPTECLEFCLECCEICHRS